MSSINWGRVILGGLLAGLVINVFEFVLNGVVHCRVCGPRWTASPPSVDCHVVPWKPPSASSSSLTASADSAQDQRLPRRSRQEGIQCNQSVLFPPCERLGE
jgi:hypothetical protein